MLQVSDAVLDACLAQDPHAKVTSISQEIAALSPDVSSDLSMMSDGLKPSSNFFPPLRPQQLCNCFSYPKKFSPTAITLLPLLP